MRPHKALLQGLMSRELAAGDRPLVIMSFQHSCRGSELVMEIVGPSGTALLAG